MKKLIFSLLRPLLLSFSLVAVLLPLMGNGTAFAAAKIPSCCPSGYYYVTNESYVGETDQIDYRVSVAPGRSASISRNYTVSNSWGANVGINSDVVSAGLGFNVTATYGVSLTCSYTNNTSSNEVLAWWSVYNLLYYDVYYHNNSGGNTYAGNGWVEQYVYPYCY